MYNEWLVRITKIKTPVLHNVRVIFQNKSNKEFQCRQPSVKVWETVKTELMKQTFSMWSHSDSVEAAFSSHKWLRKEVLTFCVGKRGFLPHSGNWKNKKNKNKEESDKVLKEINLMSAWHKVDTSGITWTGTTADTLACWLAESNSSHLLLWKAHVLFVHSTTWCLSE